MSCAAVHQQQKRLVIGTPGRKVTENDYQTTSLHM